jgi:hypothetical protein
MVVLLEAATGKVVDSNARAKIQAAAPGTSLAAVFP